MANFWRHMLNKGVSTMWIMYVVNCICLQVAQERLRSAWSRMPIIRNSRWRRNLRQRLVKLRKWPQALLHRLWRSNKRFWTIHRRVSTNVSAACCVLYKYVLHTSLISTSGGFTYRQCEWQTVRGGDFKFCLLCCFYSIGLFRVPL